MEYADCPRCRRRFRVRYPKGGNGTGCYLVWHKREVLTPGNHKIQMIPCDGRFVLLGVSDVRRLIEGGGDADV